MRISRTAVRRPVATSMVFLIITLLGGYSFTMLQVDLFPELDFPSISVVTTYPGVGPEEMENLVTEPIEGAVARVEGIEKIESFSSEGRSRVALRFEWGVSLETAVNDVRAAIERVRGRLPDDVDPPSVFKFDLSNFPIMYLALSAPNMTEGELQRFAEDIVKPRLERIPGVASADVNGARQREIQVALDPERLAALSIGPDEVVSSLRSENVTVPAGKVANGRENVLFRAMGEFESVTEVREANLRPNDPRELQIVDVASVDDGYADWNNIVRINGERGVSIRISKSPGANTTEVADLLHAEVAAFNADYPDRVELSAIVDSSRFIRRSINDVQESVLIGALLALVVLFIFLRNVGSTLVIGVAIPISIIATFGLMYAFNLTLNLITFGGIALGVGMLVDNAIVILENIYRKREEGLDAVEAAVEGSREVGGAIVASTLTTLMVFVPVVFLGGFTAVFFQQMAIVVASALLCSLFVALTLVPMLASVLLLRVQKEKKSIVGKAFDMLDDGYAATVKAVIRWPAIIVVVLGAVLAWSWTFTDDIGAELLPESDESEVRIFAQYPVGTRIEETELAVQKIESIVQEEVPEATNILATVGTPGFWSTSGEESASIRVNLVDPGDRERSSDEVARALMPRLMAAVPGMRIFARAGGGLWIFNFIRGGDARVRVEVRGYDLAVADGLAGQISGVVSEVEGVSDSRPSRMPGGKEMRLYVDRAKAADLDLSTRNVAEAISTLTQGTIAGYYREDGDEFPIRVRLSAEDLESVDSVLNTPLAVSGSRTLQVRDLVSKASGQTPKAIERLNQERIVTVSGGIDGTRDLGSINAEIEAKLQDAVQIPEGFSLHVAGEGEQQQNSFDALGLGLILALILVYMVMAGQFESFLQPIVVMLAVPFSAIGVIFTLIWTETTINLNSFLGIIVLVGVVVNNAIVLIDYINLLRKDHDYELLDAIVESARRRLRPILMTTATTVLALLPVAWAADSGSQAPLARVVVGGLLASTVVTLFLVPALYKWFAQLQGLGARLWRRLAADKRPVTPAPEA